MYIIILMTNRNAIKYNIERGMKMVRETMFEYSPIPYIRSQFIKTMHDYLYDAVATTFYPDDPLAGVGSNRVEKIFENAKRILSELIEKYPGYRAEVYHKKDMSDDKSDLYSMKIESKTLIDDDLINKVGHIREAITKLQIYLYDFIETIIDTAHNQKPKPVMYVKEEINSMEEMLEILRKVVSIIIIEIMPYWHTVWFVEEDNEKWFNGGLEFSWIETVQHRLGIIQCWIYQIKAIDNLNDEHLELLKSTDDILYDLDYTAAIKEKYNGKRRI